MFKIKSELFYTPCNGSFSLSPFSKFNWITCREVVSRLIIRRKNKDFIFYSYNSKFIFNFISTIENKINLQNKTVFDETNIKDVLYFAPSNFWFEQNIRFSLFTAFLRCASSNDINACLDSVYYTKDTKEAIWKFLDGNFWYTGKFNRGWWHTFVGNKRLNFLCRDKNDLHQ